MNRALSILTALLLLSGCATTTAPGPASLGNVPKIANSCLVDAATEFERCKAANIPCAVIAIYYRIDGKAYGHAVLVFEWLDEYTGKRRWAWDNVNKSQAISSALTDAPGISEELFADPISAHVMRSSKP